MAGMRRIHKIFVVNPEMRRRQLGRTRRKLEDNIKIDVNEVSREDVDWIRLTQNRFQWWTW